MKKLTLFILCLALISLACLDVSSAAVEASPPAVVATRVIKSIVAATDDPVIVITMTITPQLCAVVIAERAENLRELGNARSRILTHLLNGEVVQVIDQLGGEWWQVQRGDDIGFAISDYLQIVECVK